MNAIYVWGVAHALGGRVLLRIEDHDRLRSRPEYEAAILEDLDWLGFMPDEGRHPVRRQSGDAAPYEQALDTLRRAGRVYSCDCSRTQIGGERYPGRCRERRLAAASGTGLRVIVDDGFEAFDDLRLGPMCHAPAEQCGDILVRDRDGHWTYQFAVVVDDIRQGVTLVIRGEDLVSSTARQIRLARMLGRTAPPLFLHHPLLADERGKKLSKSRGDLGVRELRRLGWRPEDVIGRAAAAIGLLTPSRALRAEQVPELFG